MPFKQCANTAETPPWNEWDDLLWAQFTLEYVMYFDFPDRRPNDMMKRACYPPPGLTDHRWNIDPSSHGTLWILALCLKCKPQQLLWSLYKHDDKPFLRAIIEVSLNKEKKNCLKMFHLRYSYQYIIALGDRLHNLTESKICFQIGCMNNKLEARKVSEKK